MMMTLNYYNKVTSFSKVGNMCLFDWWICSVL